MAVGCSAWFLVLAMIFPPGAIVLYFIIRGTFFPNGRFVGLGPILGGMAAWLGIAVVVGGIGISALNSMAESSSGDSYSSRPSYTPPTVYNDRPEEPQITDEQARAAMIQAARDGDMRVVRQWLEHGVDVNSQGESGESILHIGVARSNLALVEFALASGANPSLAGDHGLTPLHIAVDRSDEEITRKLIDAGADLNAKDADGNTPLLGASNLYSAEEISAYLKSRNYRVSGNEFAYRNYAKPRHMAFLIRAGAALDEANNEGLTPLMMCCEKQNVDGIRLLLEAGAELTLRSTKGETAGEIATRKRLPAEILQLLATPIEQVPPTGDSTVGDGARQSPPTTSGDGGLEYKS